MEYSQAGNYTAIAGVIVLVLAKFGLQATASDVVAIIAGIVAFIGIIKQFTAHKSLAQSAGAIPPKN